MDRSAVKLRILPDVPSLTASSDIGRFRHTSMSVPRAGIPVRLRKREPIQCNAETKAKSSSVFPNP